MGQTGAGAFARPPGTRRRARETAIIQAEKSRNRRVIGPPFRVCPVEGGSMGIRSILYHRFAPALRRCRGLKRIALGADLRLERARHSVASCVPQVIPARPRHLTVAVTADCNLRCMGCRYGRDFMPAEQLPWPTARALLEDAKAAGFEMVRFYGGEPLLHRDLSKMVAHSIGLGLSTYVTTNGILLEQRIDKLYDAGLRSLTIGFYGTGDAYDGYVQRRNGFARLERGVAAVRRRYGAAVGLRLNWLLRRQSCSIEALHAAYGFAERYAMPIQVDLVHYSLPYFTEGPDRVLQFRPVDRPRVEAVVAELLRLREARPDMFEQTPEVMRSIPDWLLKGPMMRVPCDKYRMIWVGADGTVQMCYVTFRLGNLHQERLRDMLFTSEHRRAARGAFALQCPNCHCGYDSRIRKHAPSLRMYSAARRA